MFERLTARGCAILIAATVIVLIGTAYFYVAGSAVVIDETGEVVSATIVTGDREQALTRLWDGYFYAIPRLEGTIEVHCQDGSTKQGGYVTPHMHTEIRVKTSCARLV